MKDIVLLDVAVIVGHLRRYLGLARPSASSIKTVVLGLLDTDTDTLPLNFDSACIVNLDLIHLR